MSATHIGGEIPCSDVAFPKGNSPEEFLASMLAFLEAAAAKIANPPPRPDFSPDALRDVASIQEAVLIEKEVGKGGAGNPTVVARAAMCWTRNWKSADTASCATPRPEAEARLGERSVPVRLQHLHLLRTRRLESLAGWRRNRPSGEPLSDHDRRWGPNIPLSEVNGLKGSRRRRWESLFD
ncbi:hypothetical protein FXV83_25730 [Bradyrhizobium hipponense]|uniref:Uncharacterized protein n=1 Tax=Bradyrhizobium hipponense TaxID=2605638 RepID=A0A5S4YJD6_9BRAD|nr:hypothetical protein [Bradyrhizobium hipponense]TYO63724.1 hypothetical protein FXV83_25730 [Bradyrhizobium hipponense]